MYKFKTKFISLAVALLLICSTGICAMAEKAEPTTAASSVIGDVTGDGEVTMLDVTEMQKYIAKLVEFTPEQIKCADVNGDGKVDMLDVTTVQKYIAKLINAFSAEEASSDSDTTNTDLLSMTTDSSAETETENESEKAIIDFCDTPLMLSKLKEYETSATYEWKSEDTEGESVCVGITIQDILADLVTLPGNADGLTFIAEDGFSKTFALNGSTSGVFYSNKARVRVMLAWNVDGEDLSKLRLIVPYDGTNPNKGSWVGPLVKVVVNTHDVPDTDTSTDTETEDAIIDFCGTPLLLSELEGYETSAIYAWKSKGGEGESECIGITIQDILSDFVMLPGNAKSLTFTAEDGYSKTLDLNSSASGVFYSNDAGDRVMLAWNVDDEDLSKLRLIIPFDGTNPNKGSWISSLVKVTVNVTEP
ncbi:MAG: dockerin type I repeat-containing protein [Clostridiales bacterium]|nr:dockerin type I repeat-containing protein [Clostridiales bacterium]